MAARHDLRSVLGAVAIERDVVRVHGPEALEFLQGQLSQDVAAMAVGESRLAFLLQPTGKVDAWLRATRAEEDAVLLDVDAGFGEAVRTRLQRFRLRTKAELELVRWTGWALRGPGASAVPAPSGGWALPAAWPGVQGTDLLAPDARPAPCAEADPGSLEALRIECGVPAMGREVTDATIPAELGRWCVDASVSFTKGCYTGQELVARIDSRGGHVPRPIRGLLVGSAVDLPLGAEVHAAESTSPAGTVTSVATSPALGVVALAPLARAVEPGQQVTVRWDGDQVTASVAELPLR